MKCTKINDGDIFFDSERYKYLEILSYEKTMTTYKMYSDASSKSRESFSSTEALIDFINKRNLKLIKTKPDYEVY